MDDAYHQQPSWGGAGGRQTRDLKLDLAKSALAIRNEWDSLFTMITSRKFDSTRMITVALDRSQEGVKNG